MKKRHFILIIFVSLFLSTKVNAQDTNWVKNNTWYFDNFGRDTLPWSIFRETFIGVAPEPAGDFDRLFYSEIFQTKLAGPGHCYGMDVMAMLMKKNGGFLGYCHPPYMYSGSYASSTTSDPTPSDDTIGPTDLNLRTALEIVHGYQINHGFLSFLLDVIAQGKNRDGRYAFQQVDYYLAQDDPPVISVSKALNPDEGGHVLIPYFTETNGNIKKIYVYDPNRSWYEPGAGGHDWYVNKNNFIEVNATTGAWKYPFNSDGTFWSGDPGSGGNLLVIPISVAGKRDRLPQSLLAEGAYAINTIMIWGSVKIQQISDLSGEKRYLNDSTNNIESNDENRLNNIMKFIPMGSSLVKTKSNAYFFRGTDPLKLQYKAFGDYKIGMIYHGKYYEVKGEGKGEIKYFSPDEENVTLLNQN